MAKASWHGALYRSGAEIELVTEQQLADDIETGLRGGLPCPFQSYARANDPKTSTYDPTQEPSIIVYNDATNLYGWCMLQPLPCSNYRPVEASLEDLVRNYLPDDCVGYILVIDYECPRDCHGHPAAGEGRGRRQQEAVPEPGVSGSAARPGRRFP